MLEAMEERQITVSGKSHKLPELFMVIATQNPIEQEGTYPLPEAQMDRFLMHINIEYPNEESEMEILNMVRNEGRDNSKNSHELITQENVFEARSQVSRVQSSKEIDRYIIDLVFASRYPERYSDELASYIDVGASPRATIGIDLCSRVYAWLQGREYVESSDVKNILHDVLRHRITLSYEALAKNKSANDIIDMILKLVAISA